MGGVDPEATIARRCAEKLRSCSASSCIMTASYLSRNLATEVEMIRLSVVSPAVPA